MTFYWLHRIEFNDRVLVNFALVRSVESTVNDEHAVLRFGAALDVDLVVRETPEQIAELITAGNREVPA